MSFKRKLIVVVLILVGMLPFVREASRKNFTLINNSDHDIKRVEITKDNDNSYFLEGLRKGEIKYVHIPIPSETALATIITFDDGVILKNSSGYFEADYSAKIIVKRDKIDLDVHLPPFEYFLFIPIYGVYILFVVVFIYSSIR